MYLILGDKNPYSNVSIQLYKCVLWRWKLIGLPLVYAQDYTEEVNTEVDWSEIFDLLSSKSNSTTCELCLKLPVSQKEKDTSGTSVLAIRLKLCEHMLERGSSVKEPTTKKTSCTAQGDRRNCERSWPQKLMFCFLGNYFCQTFSTNMSVCLSTRISIKMSQKGDHLNSAYCMFLKIAGACLYQIIMLQYKLLYIH